MPLFRTSRWTISDRRSLVGLRRPGPGQATGDMARMDNRLTSPDLPMARPECGSRPTSVHRPALPGRRPPLPPPEDPPSSPPSPRPGRPERPGGAGGEARSAGPEVRVGRHSDPVTPVPARLGRSGRDGRSVEVNDELTPIICGRDGRSVEVNDELTPIIPGGGKR
jgi:hypothetical protein